MIATYFTLIQQPIYHLSFWGNLLASPTLDVHPYYLWFKRPFISGELLLTILIALYWRDKAEDFIFSEMMVLESCLMLQMTMVEVMMMMVRGQKKPKLKRKML